MRFPGNMRIGATAEATQSAMTGAVDYHRDQQSSSHLCLGNVFRDCDVQEASEDEVDMIIVYSHGLRLPELVPAVRTMR